MTYMGLTWSMRVIIRNLVSETGMSLEDVTEHMYGAVTNAYLEEMSKMPLYIQKHEGRLVGK